MCACATSFLYFSCGSLLLPKLIQKGVGGLQERRHDPKRGMSLLVEDWVSRASAMQRKGRAGRVRAGVCWGLYTRHRFEHRMRKYQV